MSLMQSFTGELNSDLTASVRRTSSMMCPRRWSGHSHRAVTTRWIDLTLEAIPLWTKMSSVRECYQHVAGDRIA
jgi:hypothetical protein